MHIHANSEKVNPRKNFENLLEDLDVGARSSLAELDLCASSEVAGGEELLARQVGPREERLGEGGHSCFSAQLLKSEIKQKS